MKREAELNCGNSGEINTFAFEIARTCSLAFYFLPHRFSGGSGPVSRPRLLRTPARRAAGPEPTVTARRSFSTRPVRAGPESHSLSLCPLVNAVVVCRWRRHREDANEREIVNRDERIGLDLIGGNAIAPIVRKLTRVIGGILTGGSALFLMRNNRY